MQTVILLFVGTSALLALSAVSATQVQNCQGSKFRAVDNAIAVSNCDTPPCKLKRKTTSTVEMKFTPVENYKKLRTTVWAMVLGIPLPFVGVDNTDACPHIFDEAGNKIGCPLQAGKTYIYKNQFKVLEVYPRLSLLVHWALQDDTSQALCFEVPARIV